MPSVECDLTFVAVSHFHVTGDVKFLPKDGQRPGYPEEKNNPFRNIMLTEETLERSWKQKKKVGNLLWALRKGLWADEWAHK